MISVLIVDDQALVRAGLRMLCDSADGLEVAAEADTGESAVRLAGALLPDVVLMDLHMPGVDGIEATARITASVPVARVVVLTTFDDDDHLYPALQAGACGFLAKNAGPDRVLAAIRAAADDERPFSPEVLARLVGRAVAHSAAPAHTPLTPRERDVAGLVGAGYTNQEIAGALHLGITTVKSYLSTAMDKTATRNRVQLAVYALRRGLVP
ncbi:response regulator transcription factor [Nocardia speluncae]|uniref:Response regulator transcription factor n=1 Tax=Nocardia speluncae TaxID=419477 RepID=A0A846X6F7_9NOCA|nr:response regulator transcription factor [Nocardia speluncae]NKY31701.1 response regulator transcription factor [Nocardia speluncae]